MSPASIRYGAFRGISKWRYWSGLVSVGVENSRCRSDITWKFVLGPVAGGSLGVDAKKVGENIRSLRALGREERVRRRTMVFVQNMVLWR